MPMPSGPPCEVRTRTNTSSSGSRVRPIARTAASRVSGVAWNVRLVLKRTMERPSETQLQFKNAPRALGLALEHALRTPEAEGQDVGIDDAGALRRDFEGERWDARFSACAGGRSQRRQGKSQTGDGQPTQRAHGENLVPVQVT